MYKTKLLVFSTYSFIKEMYDDFELYTPSVTSSETWSRFISRTKNDFAVPFICPILFLMCKKISLFHFSCQSSFNVQPKKRKIDFPNSRKTNYHVEKVKQTILNKGHYLEKNFLSFGFEQFLRGHTQFSKTTSFLKKKWKPVSFADRLWAEAATGGVL